MILTFKNSTNFNHSKHISSIRIRADAPLSFSHVFSSNSTTTPVRWAPEEKVVQDPSAGAELGFEPRRPNSHICPLDHHNLEITSVSIAWQGSHKVSGMFTGISGFVKETSLAQL